LSENESKQRRDGCADVIWRDVGAAFFLCTMHWVFQGRMDHAG